MNRAPIKTAAWNFIGFTEVNPAATPGVRAESAFAVDLPAGAWVEFTYRNQLGDTTDIAGQVVMVKDTGDDTVEVLVMGSGDEPDVCTMWVDAPVTVFVGPEGYATGYTGKYLA